MPTFETTITSKGQMTLPAEIRKLWRLKPGDRVEFLAGRDGRFFVRPRNAAPTAFFENQRPRKRLPGVSSDNEGIAKAVSERNERSKSRRAAE
jgi:antitoxin PrlF